MKKNEVKIGGVYKTKVSNNIVSVKITHERPSGGWDGLNLKTGKTVRIKTAQRLRGVVSQPTISPARQSARRKKIEWENVTEAELKAKRAKPAAKGSRRGNKIVTKAQYEAEAKAEQAAADAKKAEQAATDTKKTKPASKPAKPIKQRHTGEAVAPQANTGATATEPNAKPLSLVKAAICVLQSCERPMSCKEIVAKAVGAKIWAPRNGGLTPANTLYAAISREIKLKGPASRFTKAEPGKFQLQG